MPNLSEADERAKISATEARRREELALAEIGQDPVVLVNFVSVVIQGPKQPLPHGRGSVTKRVAPIRAATVRERLPG